MLGFLVLSGVLCSLASADGIRPSNILGGPEQHASFSFIRPGLTQTSYSFNGPSSHQAFSSSIGNPSLAQRVQPNVAQALAYRNPGLGYFGGPSVNDAQAQQFPYPGFTSAPAPQYQASQAEAYQQLSELFALRQAQSQVGSPGHQLQVPENVQAQQNLLGVAYSSAPAVAHVRVNGNGYKFNF